MTSGLGRTERLPKLYMIQAAALSAVNERVRTEGGIRMAMEINGSMGNSSVSGAGMQMGQNGMDAFSQNIQRQIAAKQKQLQEVSKSQDMSMEEKMKKRQEIQQEIAQLNNELRMHQIEQRKEQQSQKAASSDDQRTVKKTKKGRTGLSESAMSAMISADSSIKQAKVQKSTASHLEGKARVLRSELATEKGDAVIGQKQKELADLDSKAEQAVAAQASSLADADAHMKNAVGADGTDRKQDPHREDSNKTEDVQADGQTTNSQTADGQITADAQERKSAQMTYTPVNVLL